MSTTTSNALEKTTARVSYVLPIPTDESKGLQYKVLRTWEKLSQDGSNPELKTKLDKLLKEKKAMKSLQLECLAAMTSLNHEEMNVFKSFSESNENLDVIAKTELLTKTEKCKLISFLVITAKALSPQNLIFFHTTDLLSPEVKDNLFEIRYGRPPLLAI